MEVSGTVHGNRRLKSWRKCQSQRCRQKFDSSLLRTSKRWLFPIARYFPVRGAHRYHHTAPITMFYALREGLNLVLEEGVEARYARHKANHEKLVAGLEELGMEMLVKPGSRMWALHTPKVPTGVNDLDVRKKLMERHGIEIQGGFGPLAGQVFRIGLMGEGSTSDNVDLLLGALREALV